MTNLGRLAGVVMLPVLGVMIASGCAQGGGGGEPAAPAAEKSSGAVDMGGGTPAGASSVKAVNAGECTKSALIDDAEDNNNQGAQADKRGGYWYTYSDKLGTTIAPTGNFAMSEGGAEKSKFAARMNGKVGSGDVLYAGMGLSLTDPKGPYDASCCKGVSFWAKKAGAGTGNVRFKIGDVNTSPEGGVCKQCYNDFGADLALTAEWKKYEIPFADMKQESGWGDQQSAIDAGRIYQLQWQVKEAGAEYDVWVDDVQFMGCGG